MTEDGKDPYRQFRFRIEIGGTARAGFQKVTFFDAAAAVTEFHEESRFKALQKLPGLDRHANISLKQGITDSLDLCDWYKKAIDSGGAAAGKNMSIIMTDEAGTDTARWDLMNAWPTKYIQSSFTATGNEIAIESMEIVCEGFTRVR